MYNNAIVSVILPVYNQEKYLDATYACLADQSYSNLEIIFVNDGSTDASAEMLQSYAQRDNRVKIIDKPNGGLVDATLTGISAVTGDFICFLDPDDRVGPDYIQFYLSHMHDDCDFVAAGIYTENGETCSTICLREDRIYTQKELRQYTNVFFFENDCPGISNRFFVSRCNKLYRTNIVQTIAPLFSAYKHLSLGEDTIFTYLLLQHSCGGRTVSQPNTYYYNTGNSNSMTKSSVIDAYLSKATAAFRALLELTQRFNTSPTQAYALYASSVDGLVCRTRNSPQSTQKLLARKLLFNHAYYKGCAILGMKHTFLKDLGKAILPGQAVSLLKKILKR